ncbi:hypothetical protein BH11CYA1_BH11CYA1_23700 [soil metagenome]
MTNPPEPKVPLDVPTSKEAAREVAKEGDKPQEYAADSQQARLALALEASKKPEQKAVAKATDDSMVAYISSGIDKASSLLSDAVNMLPTLTIDDKQAASAGKVDIGTFLKENCKKEGAAPVCDTKTVDSGIGGFKFNTGETLVENKESKSQLTVAETKLTKSDWNKVFAIYDSQNPSKAGQVERTADAVVHRDNTGHADVIKTAEGTRLRTADGGALNVGDAGDKIKIGPDGKPQAGFDAQGKFTAQLDSGNRMEIAKDSEIATFYDANGVPFGQVFNRKNGEFEVVGEYKDGQLRVTNGNMTTNDGLAKIVEDAAITAGKTHKTVVVQAADGIVAVAADKTFVALQNDGSSLVSMPDGRYLVRSKTGDLSIVSPDGSEEKISKEFLNSIRESKKPEMAGLRKAAAQLVEFSLSHQLKTADGKATLTNDGTTLSATTSDFVTNRNGSTVTTENLATGATQTVDTVNKTVENKSADGTVDRIEAKPNGKFRVQTKNYTYDSGSVTTKEGDVFSADHVRLANGTEVDRDNNITLADGTTIKADGTYYSQAKAKVEMMMASKAAESKAASMAGYAEGMAGAIRSRAASGHATASDIASLESVFAGLCDAVASLGMVGDPSVSFKLYSAKGTVAESISTGLANLNTNNTKAA